MKNHLLGRAVIRHALIAIALTLTLGACASKPAARPAPSEPVEVPVASIDDVVTVVPQAEDSSAILSEAERSARAELARTGTVIYFDYDSSSIRAEFLPLVTAHAQFADRFGRSLRLEGHTDERGSREYNIGLGERRAQAVKQALTLQGTADSRIQTVSYGEERPASSGSTEANWSRNRRVEIMLP